MKVDWIICGYYDGQEFLKAEIPLLKEDALSILQRLVCVQFLTPEKMLDLVSQDIPMPVVKEVAPGGVWRCGENPYFTARPKELIP